MVNKDTIVVGNEKVLGSMKMSVFFTAWKIEVRLAAIVNLLLTEFTDIAYD